MAIGFRRRLHPHEFKSLGWGVVDQVLWSSTNFLLTILAGRLLGPEGLGTIFLGFSSYLLALGFARALVIDPLIASSSAGDGSERRSSTRSALSILVVYALVVTVILLGIGRIVGGGLGRGLVLFAPWMLPAIVQDLWRAVLFRDGRGHAAAFNDAAWLATMAIAAPLAWLVGDDSIVLSCWGAGAAAGMLLGFMQVKVLTGRLRDALKWWEAQAWPLGKWLGAEGIAFTLGTTLTILALGMVLGMAGLGGLKAVQTLFAPLAMLAPALALPGLPALARAVAVGGLESTRRLASGLCGLALIAGAAYLAVVAMFSDALSVIFGKSFVAFENIIVPMGCAQVLVAAGSGAVLLLKAEKRGRALLGARAAGSAASLLLVTILAWRFGLGGAAWGFALAAMFTTGAMIVLALRPAGGVRGSFVLQVFRVIPSSAYQYLRRVPYLARSARALLDLLMPQGRFVETQVIAGPLRGMVLEVDPRVHKEMLVGHYESHVQDAIGDLVHAGDTVFDVGAHLGYFSLCMAARVGANGKVVAFEPDPHVSNRFLKNVDLNTGQVGAIIRPVRAAVGSVSGRAHFLPGSDSSTGRVSMGNGGFDVDMVTLDEIKAQFGDPSLIKIDVEGGEIDVLKGSREILEAGQAALIIEMHSDELERECTRLLEGYGYECRRLFLPARRDVHILAMPRAAS